MFTIAVGTAIHPRNLGRDFRVAAARAGVPAVHLHDLCHTAATLALTAGAHPKQVQEMLGHARVAITLDVYSHVTPHMHEDDLEGRPGGLRCVRLGRRLLVPVWVMDELGRDREPNPANLGGPCFGRVSGPAVWVNGVKWHTDVRGRTGGRRPTGASCQAASESRAAAEQGDVHMGVRTWG